MNSHDGKSQSKALSKPIVSNRLPKAFSQATKLQHKASRTDLEAEQEHKQVKVLLSPIKLTQDQRGNIKRALKKLKMLPITVNTQSLDTAVKLQQNSPDFLTVSQAKLEDLITLRVLANSQKNGVTRKVLHALTLKMLTVRQLPVSTRESRQSLVDWLAKWQQLQRKNMQLLPVSASYWNSPEGCVSVILEHMNAGSVKKLIEDVGSLPEAALANLTCQILHAVAYLHKKGLVHGQLTPSQLLLNRDGFLKLAPGLSARLTTGLEGSRSLRVRDPTFADDIYTLGQTLLTACCGGTEWLDRTVGIASTCCILHSILKDHLAPPLIRVSANFHDFLCRCLRTDPTQRLPIEELLQHPWIYQMTYPGPKVSVSELLSVTCQWQVPDLFTAVGERDLARVCEALSVVLVGNRPLNLSEGWAGDLAADLGISEAQVTSKIRAVLADQH